MATHPVTIEGKGLWNGRCFVIPSIPSTNRWMLHPPRPLKHGDVLRAVRQTDGHGRFGRPWLAPKDRALTLSILLDTTRLPERLPAQLTQAAALAIVQFLRNLQIPAGIKWPNDVLVNGRKIAGILAERLDHDSPIILGIGLNVNLRPDDLPPNRLRTPATSILIETGRTHAVPQLCRELLRILESTLDSLAHNPETIHHAWEAADLLLGRRIRIETPAGIQEGTCRGVIPSGELLLQLPDGAYRTFASGDVSLLPAQP